MITEGIYAGEFLLTSAGTRSRDVLVIDQNQTLKPGSVLGQISHGAGSAVAAAKAGNTGNGAMGAVTVAAGTPEGIYQLEIIEPAANAGAFRVEGPDGVEIGHGAVAAAFAGGGLGFTLADGATDFVAGDGFTITVTDAVPANAGRYALVTANATDGSATARAICWDHIVTGAGEHKEALGITRDVEVKQALLDFGALDDSHKATATGQLASHGIIARS